MPSTPSYLRPTIASQARRLATVCKSTSTKLLPLRFSSKSPRTGKTHRQDSKAHSSNTVKTHGKEDKQQEQKKESTACEEVRRPILATAPAVKNSKERLDKNVTWADYIPPSLDDTPITGKTTSQEDKGTGEEEKKERKRKRRRETVGSMEELLRFEQEVVFDDWPGPFYQQHKNKGGVNLFNLDCELRITRRTANNRAAWNRFHRSGRSARYRWRTFELKAPLHVIEEVEGEDLEV